MKKFIFLSLICILLLCGCSNEQKVNLSNSTNEQIESEITSNFSKIMESSDLTSSNPYDYINNEYYDNIVKLGKDAVPVLEDMFDNGKISCLEAYISALAIQDITECNLYEKYNLDWSTAEEFFELWKDNNCSYSK